MTVEENLLLRCRQDVRWAAGEIARLRAELEAMKMALLAVADAIQITPDA